MKTLLHSDVANLIHSLPESKLQEAYQVLTKLANSEDDVQSPQLRFIRLPLDERRRVLAEQAEQMKAHYEQTKGERDEWQGGDFIENHQAR